MIRLLTAGEAFPDLPETEAAVKLWGWWSAYGADRPFVRFWQTENGGALAAMGDTALACVPADDREEAALFLTMQSDVGLVRSDPAFVETLSHLRKGETDTGTVMRLTVPVTMDEPVSAPALSDTYTLLKTVFGDTLPPFEDWYVDMSHRLRHGQARVVGITDGGLAAVAMTTAECPFAGLIGGVATRQESRGKGYAHRLVMWLAAALQQEGKAVWLSPKNAYAKALYSRWGFVPVGEWAQIKWKD